MAQAVEGPALEERVSDMVPGTGAHGHVVDGAAGGSLAAGTAAAVARVDARPGLAPGPT